jgi:hypothetical protein
MSIAGPGRVKTPKHFFGKRNFHLEADGSPREEFPPEGSAIFLTDAPQIDHVQTVSILRRLP